MQEPMIKANELMVGNYLKSDVVVKIDARSIFDIWEHSKKYDPIPLTKEWLLKLGFNNSKTQDKFFIIDNNIGISTADNKFMFIQGNFICQLVLREIEHVHQLQNLYFALMGKELTMTN